MGDRIGCEPGGLEKVLFVAIIVAILFLGVAGGQPYWRGEEMLDNYESNCDKRGGILLSSKNMMGTNYQCVEDWNN